MYTLLGFSLIFFLIIALILILKSRNIHTWFLSYLKHELFKPNLRKNKVTHVMFCFVDHYEPQWANKNDIEKEHARVDRWFVDYPKITKGHKDSDGFPPKHTFFFPEEEYREEHLNKLSDLCARNYGDIEVHIHHDNDTSENFKSTITSFTEKLHDKHGAFSRNTTTNLLQYAFIHGNWALDNSRHDGKWCGINNELICLKETGCYADFTLPSAPSETQTKKINSIYYAKDNPTKPKSHNTGIDVEVGKKPSDDLMIIQGPLTLNMKERKFGFLPHIENSDIRSCQPPSNNRVDLWVNTAIHVKGKPDWIFIKIHTHGAQEKDMETLLGSPIDKMYTYLETKYNDGTNYLLHYVTSREMYNIIKAAEKKKPGNPNKYRDYIIKQPEYNHL